MRALYDSNDFANDVWKSLAANWSRYRFENLDALMAFLRNEAVCKIIDEYRRQYAQRRDADRVTRLGSMEAPGGRPVELASTDPTPSKVVMADETAERLLAGNTSVEQRVISLARDGHTKAEVAEEVGWHIRKVQRFLQNLAHRVDPNASRRAEA